MNEPPLRIAVCGGSTPEDAGDGAAQAVGRAIAAAGAVLVCGGRGGCMEAAARGAAEAGGLVIGVLPGADAAEANPYVTIPLATGMGEARNALVVRFAEAVIAIGGAWGTLSEIALARRLDVPVILLAPTLAAGLELPRAEDAGQAVAWALKAARAGRAG
jgi:hypothetical protein